MDDPFTTVSAPSSTPAVDDPLTTWGTARQLWLSTVTSEDVPGPAAHCGRCKLGVWSDTDGGARFFSSLPLHFLKVSEWTGLFWQQTTLAHIGLVYQLGHDGLDCNSAVKGMHSTLVLHTTGIQTLHYQFCGCGGTWDAEAQLAAAGFIVASASDSGTAATPSLLDLFASLRLQ
ncbi:hypothetical protein C8R43DRAFT_1122703 [Mycena crocata]|nr:hypothetical protein C8R43DRAFT_1122703 [Mycena crocata]